jgi:hypothetical protein
MQPQNNQQQQMVGRPRCWSYKRSLIGEWHAYVAWNVVASYSIAVSEYITPTDSTKHCFGCSDTQFSTCVTVLQVQGRAAAWAAVIRAPPGSAGTPQQASTARARQQAATKRTAIRSAGELAGDLSPRWAWQCIAQGVGVTCTRAVDQLLAWSTATSLCAVTEQSSHSYACYCFHNTKQA